ncbi:hypothetical protein BJ138DRAFT_1008718 [Hygrophoropsis aurantiaca]|uniref:Uncharacterized protein n=1 Tax=Hygrophoropsis aurantiaca TaxID=72124 RepID=A0ACB8AB21_9AGAM|nr:hypothetical protein BJ138DRAFT_1008718 [Hygrophoropsis aurantiaca]
MLATLALTALASLAILVRADPDPTNPGPGDVFIEGQTCSVGWDVDTTGVWKSMSIELKTGDNFNMVYLTTVGVVDGTDPTKTTFSYPCPQVSPHSPIYFYQFSSPASTDNLWTGRFTITDNANDIIAPTQSTQPDGENIPWGTGKLVNASASSSIPPPIGGTSVSATGTALGTPSSAPPTMSGSSSPSMVSSGGAGATVVYVTSTASASPSAGAGTGSSNSAVGLMSAQKILVQTGLALGVSALGFTVLL